MQFLHHVEKYENKTKQQISRMKSTENKLFLVFIHDNERVEKTNKIIIFYLLIYLHSAVGYAIFVTYHNIGIINPSLFIMCFL